MRSVRMCVVVCLLACVWLGKAFAAVITWSSSLSSPAYYITPSNWVGGVVPGSGDTAVFPLGISDPVQEVFFPQGTTSLANLEFLPSAYYFLGLPAPFPTVGPDINVSNTTTLGSNANVSLNNVDLNTNVLIATAASSFPISIRIYNPYALTVVGTGITAVSADLTGAILAIVNSGGTASFEVQGGATKVDANTLIGLLVFPPPSMSPSAIIALNGQGIPTGLTQSTSLYFSDSSPVSVSLSGINWEKPGIATLISLSQNALNGAGDYLTSSLYASDNNNLGGFILDFDPIPPGKGLMFVQGPPNPTSLTVLVLSTAQNGHASLLQNASGRNVRITNQLSHLKQTRLEPPNAPTPQVAYSSSEESAYVAQNDPLGELAQGGAGSQRLSEQLSERSIAAAAKPWSVYAGPILSFGQIQDTHRFGGTHYQSMGVRGGCDCACSNEYDPSSFCAYGLGLVIDYIHYTGTVNRDFGRFAVDQIYGNLYGTLAPKKIAELSFNAIVGGGFDWYDSYRYMASGSSIGVTPGNTQGPQVDALLGVEYAFSHARFSSIPSNFRFIPLATLQYAWIRVDGYTERMEGMDGMPVFHINENSLDSLESMLGFRSNYCIIAAKNLMVRSEISVAWEREYLDTSILQEGTVLGTSTPATFSFLQDAFNRNTLYVGANFRIESNNQFMAELEYDFFYNSGFITNSFYLEVRGMF